MSKSSYGSGIIDFLLNLLTIVNLMPERGRYLIDPAMSQSDVP